MSKYLIEVPHDEDEKECARVVEVFLKSGSHFLTHADWGCRDGEHKAWIMADVNSKQDAIYIIPPAFRTQAKVVSLSKFSMKDVDEVLRQQ